MVIDYQSLSSCFAKASSVTLAGWFEGDLLGVLTSTAWKANDADNIVPSE